jgi:hypothetical protein
MCLLEVLNMHILIADHKESPFFDPVIIIYTELIEGQTATNIVSKLYICTVTTVIGCNCRRLRLHSDGSVQSNYFAVHHRVLQNTLDEVCEFVGVTESRGKWDRLCQLLTDLLGESGQ